MTAAGVGRTLFRWRGWIPLPGLVLLVVVARPGAASLAAGGVLALLGEALRLWAVRHVGPGSRTRGDDVGTLARGGPYRWSRNPLYVGNLLIWSGLATTAAAPIGLAVPLLLALHYRLVIAWEEERLRVVHPVAYAMWSAQVPRWIALWPRAPRVPPSWTRLRALRSERATLAAVTAAYALVAWRSC